MIRSVPRPTQTVGAIVLVLGILATLGITALSGTKTGVALALAAVLGPIAGYGALVAPLVFPFTAFVMLVPFDNLLALPAFGTLTRLLAIACGGSLVLWLIRTRRMIAPDRALVFWLVLAVWATASLTWAIDPNASYAHLFTLAQLLGLYIAVSLIPIERRSLRIVLMAVALSGVVAAAYGFYVFRHGVQVNAAGRLWLQNDNDIVDPNQFAAALLLPISLVIVALLRANFGRVWLACAAGLGVMGLGIAISGSRGAVLALAAALLYILVRLRTRLIAAGVAVAGLGCALAFSGASLMQRFAIAASSDGAGRLDIWRVGLNAFRQHAWIGAGFSNFTLAYDQSFLTVTEHHYTWWHRAPHNMLLQMSVELGVVGLLAFLAAYIAQFRAMRDINRQDPLFPVRIAVEGALIGLFIASLFLDIFTTKYFWLAFMLAMLVRNAAYAPQRVSSPSCESNSSPIAARRSPMTN